MMRSIWSEMRVVLAPLQDGLWDKMTQVGGGCFEAAKGGTFRCSFWGENFLIF